MEEHRRRGPEAEPREVDRYLEALRGVGCRITGQRRRIVEALLEAPGDLEAQDLFLRARALDPSVGRATVYRTLELLGDLGLVHRREGEGAQRFAPAEDRTRLELVCRCCGRTQEAPVGLVEDLRSGAQGEGFSLLGQRISLRGGCDACRGGGEVPRCAHCGGCRCGRRRGRWGQPLQLDEETPGE